MGDPSHYWKIHVTFPNPEEMGFAGESMHGERLGDGPTPGTGFYKIGNIPFFAGLRLHDVIVCDESDPEVIPEFVSVHEQAPQPTARLIFVDGTSDEDMIAFTKRLRELGADTERGMNTFWAVALPEGPSLRGLALQLLEESDLVLQFELVED